MPNRATRVNGFPWSPRRIRRFWIRGSREGRFAAAVVALGALLRLLFWWLYPENWRLHAAFTPIETSFIGYVSDFQGYQPSRMPFYDAATAGTYLLTNDLFGVRALSLFAVATSIASLPLFYWGVASLFDRRTALYSALLYAFHPQTLVLAGQGFAVAASSAFIVGSLYAVVRGRSAGGVGSWLLLGGLCALLAYLMFVPAVLVGILFTLWLVGTTSWRQGERVASLLPAASYAAIPGIGGVAYLIYGPFPEVITRTTGASIPQEFVFVTRSYALPERIGRYLTYTHIDFWWHTPGFDNERHIMQLAAGLEAFLGDWFVIYASGWAAITGAFTICIIIGVAVLLVDRDSVGMLMLSWVAVYVAIWNVKNLGWTGGFNTRHVYPLFPAICILFGIGARKALTSAATVRISQRLSGVDQQRVLHTTLALAFVLLLVNAGVQGTIRQEKRSVISQQPLAQLDELVEPGDLVAVTGRRDYDYTIMYSGGRIRPDILHPANGSDAAFRKAQGETNLATVRRVDAGEISKTDVDYLFLRNYQCRRLGEFERQLMAEAKRGGGEVLYRRSVRRARFRCSEFNVFIVSNK